MAGLRVGKPVGVLLPLDVIAVVSPWPMGIQPPLAMQALTIIIIGNFVNPSLFRNP